MGNAVIVAIFPDPTSVEDLGAVIDVAQRNFKGVNPDVKLVLMNGAAANTVEFFATNQSLPVDEEMPEQTTTELGLGGTYRKKAIKIEAQRLCWNNWNAVCDFVGEGHPGIRIPAEEASDLCGEIGPDYISIEVTTIHGDKAIVRHGDWIIPESEAGKFYPCKPDVFERTYERVIQ